MSLVHRSAVFTCFFFVFWILNFGEKKISPAAQRLTLDALEVLQG